ncbi:UNVERIFIED_CONTAM: aminotransferase, partial [Bifidobacterium longum]|nr:aminotransferase [Bifidobacterium longum]
MENEPAHQPQSPAASPVMSRRAREANPSRAMVFGEPADKTIPQATTVIKFSLGEPDFGSPPAVRAALREQYDGGAPPQHHARGL